MPSKPDAVPFEILAIFQAATDSGCDERTSIEVAARYWARVSVREVRPAWCRVIVDLGTAQAFVSHEVQGP